ncbi:MAG: hypothetical protein QW717_04240 [Candidatus Bathyarchaeia archaeon]
MVKKKKASKNVEFAEPVAVEEASFKDDLKARLDEIKGCEGYVGYILRNSKSAAIDLKDPSKLIDYAILSASAIDAQEELSELFNLGEVKTIFVYGREVKTVSFTAGDQKVSVFMEKNADLEGVLKRLRQS